LVAQTVPAGDILQANVARAESDSLARSTARIDVG
jgi:hypothetical protein